MPKISHALPNIGRLFGLIAALALLLIGQVKSFADPMVDPRLILSAPVLTNDQIQLTLNCESGITYILQSSCDLQHWNSILTNSDPSMVRIFNLAAPGTVSFYRVKRDPLPLFAYAVAGRTNIITNGNGLSTDSFNSASTNFSTRGRYDSAKTSTNGDVAVLYGTVDLGNHTVTGDVYLGPTATLVGSPSQISGTISTNFNYDFPSLVPPDTTAWFTLLTTLPRTAPDGNLYDYVFTNSANYVTPNLNGSIYVGSNATVRLLAQAGSTSKILVAGGGSTSSDHGTLTVYIAASSFTIGGSGNVDGGRAANLAFYSLPSCTSISISGNGGFTGTLYANNASLTLFGGGSSSHDIVGSIIAKSVIFNGHFMFHFDEDLLAAGPKR
jgi:hypothetical protein